MDGNEVQLSLDVLLGTVVTDVETGIQRSTFGSFDLFYGISVVIIEMCLFGLPEIIANIDRLQHGPAKTSVRLCDMRPTREDVRQSVGPVARGGLLGSLLTALPATGPTIAAFLAYALEKRISRHPERLGTGIVEDLAGLEAAKNAAALTALIPTLTLGIPRIPRTRSIIEPPHSPK